MNDFTKEELQIILLDMNIYINNAKSLTESPIHFNLRKKIESMIENYSDVEIKKEKDTELAKLGARLVIPKSPIEI